MQKWYGNTGSVLPRSDGPGNAIETRHGCDVKRAKEQLILIVDIDAHFREGLYNFLLSAGYERVDSAENYHSALEKTKKTEYDVLLLDAVSRRRTALEAANTIVASNPKTRVILMVEPQGEEEPNDQAESKTEFQYLIKATFARNLLYLLDSGE